MSADDRASEREEMATLLGAHHPEIDSRDEIKRCSCGLLFGIQHQANGSYEGHRLDVILAAGWSRTPSPVDMDAAVEALAEVLQQVVRGLVGGRPWSELPDAYRKGWREQAAAALPHLSSAPVVGGGVDLAAALAPLIELGEEWVAAGRLRAQTATGSPRSITQDMLMGTSEEAHGKSLLRALRAVLGGGDL